MITIVLTCRDRESNIVEKCLHSLSLQSNQEFQIIFVDYGSSTDYVKELNVLLSKNPEIQCLKCPVSKQLWNKSRAINIALQKTTNPFFFVADIDMIFHKDFIQKLYGIKDETAVTYFQVGFLDKNQSERNCHFEDYKISFNSTKDATGMTLYPTELLMKINGFDEFYHGWGSEDTDVHIRLKNSGVAVEYYDEEILILHQWHPKFYRSSKNKAPFHNTLERINAKYLSQTKELKKITANLNYQWGIIPNQNDYLDLSRQDVFISITNETAEVDALLIGTLPGLKNTIVHIEIKKNPLEKSYKNSIKKMLGKKHQKFYNLEKINNLLLETILSFYRNQPYEYNMDETTIKLRLKL